MNGIQNLKDWAQDLQAINLAFVEREAQLVAETNRLGAQLDAALDRQRELEASEVHLREQITEHMHQLEKTQDVIVINGQLIERENQLLAELSRIEQDRNAVTEKLKQLDNTSNQYIQDLTDLQTTFADLRNERDLLQGQVHRLVQEQISAAEKLSQFDDTSRQHWQDITDLQSTLANVRNERDLLQGQVHRLVQEQISAAEKLSQFDDTSRQHWQDITDLQSTLANVRNERDLLQGQVHRLVQEQISAAEKLSQFDDTSRQHWQDITDLQSTLANVRNERDLLQEQMRSSVTHNSQLTSEITDLILERKERNLQLDTLKTQLATAEAMIFDAQESHKFELNALHEGNAIEKNALATEVERKSDQINALADRIGRLEADLEERALITSESRAREVKLQQQVSTTFDKLTVQDQKVTELLTIISSMQADSAKTGERHANQVEAIAHGFQLSIEELKQTYQSIEMHLHNELVEMQALMDEAYSAKKTALDALHQIKSSRMWRALAPVRWLIGANYSDISSYNNYYDKAPIAPNSLQVNLSTTPKSLSTPEEYPVSETIKTKLNFPTEDLSMSKPIHPQTPLTTVDALLDLHDEDFVRCTYLTILGRSPDPSGFTHYLGLIRRGEAKGAIIASIGRSQEARNRQVELPGLNQLIERYPRRLPPFLGRLIRRAFRATTDQLETQVRSTENLIYRLHQDDKRRFDQIDAAIADIQRQMSDNLRLILENSIRIDPSNSQQTPVVNSTHTKKARRFYYYVDHTVVCPTNTGMQRVVRRLADALVRAGQNPTFVKWSPVKNKLVLISRNELKHLSRWNGPSISTEITNQYPEAGEVEIEVGANKYAVEDLLLIPEVTHINFHGKNLTLDVIAAAAAAKLSTAFIFYDATPLRRPELAPMSAVHAEYMQQLMLADLVFPISEWVATDLRAFLSQDQMCVQGIKPIIQTLFLPGESQLLARVRTAPSRAAKRILSVGSIVPHKNQMLLVHAFEQLCAERPELDWELALAGNLHPDLAGELHLATVNNPRIKYLGEVEDEHLAELYHTAAFTVFPSVMEGFGLPILESLWFSRPCICANFGAMSEVAAGGGCLTVDTRELSQLKSAITRLIDDPALFVTLQTEAMTRPIQTWSDYASKLVSEVQRFASPLRNLGTIYYWVDQTSHYHSNTGIQRVVRGLARVLIESGAELIPVRWSQAESTLVRATDSELEHLARWNGPRADSWSAWKPLSLVTQADWLLVPEVTHLQTKAIRDFAHANNLRCAWVFHDSIPAKLKNIYPPEAVRAHTEYMHELALVDRVLPNSLYSTSELLQFLTQTNTRHGELEHRIITCPLPGEFLESPRNLAIKLKPAGQTIKVLCVGTVEPRKNHLTLLEAFRQLKSTCTVDVELVIVGGDPFVDLSVEVQKQVDELPGTKWIRKSSDTELQKLYDDCDFTVYPSIEEGFGLPILESIWNARPCICASHGAMREVAEGGGCLIVDVRDATLLKDGIQKLTEDKELVRKLTSEAIARPFLTWMDYASSVLEALASERQLVHNFISANECQLSGTLYDVMPNLKPRPLLSICISTYNRAAWLGVNLRNLARLWPTPHPDVELLICDNTSTDNTPDIVKGYLSRPDFKYVRNPENVGMLGNLRVTANAATGQYVWILGDDDLLLPGTIERVLSTIRNNPLTALVYMNYAYTRNDNAETVQDIDVFLNDSTPIGPVTDDAVGTVRDMCAKSENFFTAIYCLVLRRDHAIRAYSQDTNGRPFSSMLSCIPTTYHVLNYMMDEPACWIGAPQLVVNMNVSWMRYASLWILERLPEAFDVAQRYGGDPLAIDQWRLNLIPSINHFMSEICSDDPEGNAEFISIRRLVNRLKHLEEFKGIAPQLKESYLRAQEKGMSIANLPAEDVFGSVC
ncbi:glycosyltransferase [Limnohabitans sp. MMS-10A-178]|uniref:glycosyltransferase n=1 Tax=Limnohabitans sp. MMS-10A-178 TaxID=1835767 RepID=UPI000D36608F|nr:glycosyltransferase [Limnohabitans sp. MMS-10A-178]PUE16066.1 hypothetical protein B9Z32_00035 [Limnohabitans sp. MMS-10A-178]